MNKTIVLTFLLAYLFNPALLSQDLDSLVKALEGEAAPVLALSTFRTSTVINGQSVEVPGKNDLHFIIAHRFGAVNLGLYEMFGLDHATARFAFEYGITKSIGISIGRSTWEKTYDGSIKARLLQQQSGIKNIPVSVTWYSAAFSNTLKWEQPERENLL
jgi:hypothetical protein